MATRRDDEQLIDRQIAYYRARAQEFDDGHHHPTPELARPLSAFEPRGRVVEIACGTGIWTKEILRHPVEALLCIDAAPEMLAIHEGRIDDVRVRRELCDVFRWQPSETFDAAVFTFWLSHVPPSRFAAFWEAIGRALAPDGRAFFIDDDHRAAALEEVIDGSSVPAVRRTLADGSAYEAIKTFHEPGTLAARLSEIGWVADVRSVADRFLWGIAKPGHAGRAAAERTSDRDRSLTLRRSRPCQRDGSPGEVDRRASRAS